MRISLEPFLKGPANPNVTSYIDQERAEHEKQPLQKKRKIPQQ